MPPPYYENHLDVLNSELNSLISSSHIAYFILDKYRIGEKANKFYEKIYNLYREGQEILNYMLKKERDQELILHHAMYLDKLTDILTIIMDNQLNGRLPNTL